MKAIILSSLIFFSLRAMSTEVGQKLKPEECTATAATNKREPKKVAQVETSVPKEEDKKGSMKK